LNLVLDTNVFISGYREIAVLSPRQFIDRHLERTS